jgi:hypothetical protein
MEGIWPGILPWMVLRRSFAYLVDGVLVGAMIFAVAVLLTLVLGPTFRIDRSAGPPRVTVDTTRAFANAVIATAISGAYFVGSWSRLGRSPGHRLLGLRVQDAGEGRHLPVRSAVVRWVAFGGPIGVVSLVAGGFVGAAIPTFFGVIWLLALWLSTALARTNRGFHDRVSQSVVVREEERSADLS